MSQKFQVSILVWVLFLIGSSRIHGQTYEVVQTFESGGTGTDECWTGYGQSGNPPTGLFYTQTTRVQSGTTAGGMFTCCGGPSIKTPTYYISPVLPEGSHSVLVYLMQSSQFDENFEIGTVNGVTGGNFTESFTKSVWPFPVAWELVSILVTTDPTNNRVAFRVPPASSKTYYLDSIVIGNSGNSNSACTYSTTTSVRNLGERNALQIFPNPCTESIRIENPSDQFVRISLYDFSSKEVLSQSFSGSFECKVSSLKSGLYLYILSDKNGLYQRGKLVKE